MVFFYVRNPFLVTVSQWLPSVPCTKAYARWNLFERWVETNTDQHRQVCFFVSYHDEFYVRRVCSASIFSANFVLFNGWIASAVSVKNFAEGVYGHTPLTDEHVCLLQSLFSRLPLLSGVTPWGGSLPRRPLNEGIARRLLSFFLVILPATTRLSNVRWWTIWPLFLPRTWWAFR